MQGHCRVLDVDAADFKPATLADLVDATDKVPTTLADRALGRMLTAGREAGEVYAKGRDVSKVGATDLGP